MSVSPSLEKVKEFLDAFEEVFDKDWPYTREMLGVCLESEAQKAARMELGLETLPIITDDGTFIRPEVENEIEDWGNRGRLLAAYRALKEAVS